MSLINRHIHINGIVQGVGFRPFIYNLALEHGLNGWVRNSAGGVDIEISGSAQNVEDFIRDVEIKAPPLAQIDSIHVETMDPSQFDNFEIVPSENQSSDFIPVSPDMAICEQCQEELFNPSDRRFRYPFINCTNCGPRYTIIKEIPYDRPKTTMASFTMCPECRAEYENPRDRRFHAQPVACPICGPQVTLEDNKGFKIAEKDEAILKARERLASGQILAIKGLGGFHLACDATNQAAVQRLRERKQRPDKPFALMAFDLKSIRDFVAVSQAAADFLCNPRAPIVLLPRLEKTKIAEGVAPQQNTLGFMLPYTPLHLLLLEPTKGFPKAFVMTSGNLSEEPILHHNGPARETLSGIADAFLLHDRPIYQRIDDSVFSMVQGQPYPIRRARGFAPNPIRLSQAVPSVLAVGPQMKNTFCLTRDRYAFLSHYIGEMENWETYQDYQKAIDHYRALFRIKPIAIAYDMHPDYLTTHYALEQIAKGNLLGIPVQHHHAHLVACLAENGLSPQERVAGLIYDGTGYGNDGTIWGGEVLLGNCNEFERLYYLTPVPLPGGDITIRKPARMALSYLWAWGLPWSEDLSPIQALTEAEISTLRIQLERKSNTFQTSSMGRLFDAVSALIGVRQSISYEAQAAVELEAVADPEEMGYYPWKVEGQQINMKPMLEAVLADLTKNESKARIAARFHNTIAQMSLQIAQQIRQDWNINQIVLSGGVWQNRFLLEKTIQLLNNNGLQPLVHRQTPPNDGCVAFGQALIAACQLRQNKE